MYADDNPDNLLAMRWILKGQDYILLEAQNGRAAIELALREHPDLILMDIRMPVMNGLEATRQLKSMPETAETPIIMLTSSALAGDRQASFDAGCDAYMTKPIIRADILTAIAAQIQKRYWEA